MAVPRLLSNIRPLQFPVRLTLRRIAHAPGSGATQAQRQDALRVLANDVMSQDLEDQLHLRLQQVGIEPLTYADPPPNLFKGQETTPTGSHPLLLWLWNNRATILAFVEQIIALFGGGTTPSAPAVPLVRAVAVEQQHQPGQ